MNPQDEEIDALLIGELDGTLTEAERHRLEEIRQFREIDDLSETDRQLRAVLCVPPVSAVDSREIPFRRLVTTEKVDPMPVPSPTFPIANPPDPTPSVPTPSVPTPSVPTLTVPTQGRKFPWRIATAIAASVAVVWYMTGSSADITRTATANDDGWPQSKPPATLRQPSLADVYGQVATAPPAEVKPGDSVGQKAVAEWVAAQGVMPSVKKSVKDNKLNTTYQLVPGKDEFKVLTTSQYENLAAIDEVLTLVSRPDVYPGALVQGESVINGVPVKLRFPEAKLAEQTYVLLGATPALLPVAKGSEPHEQGANLPTKNFVELARSQKAKPSMATAEAVKAKLLNNVKLPAHYSKNLTHAYSAQHLQTQLGVTANYLTASAKLSVATSTKKEKAIVVLLLRQEHFKIAVDAPRVAEWFTPDVTMADFEQLKLEASKQNVPCFVSSVGYGRLVMLMAESDLDHSKVEAALSAEYSAGFASANLRADVAHRSVLESTTFRLMVYGGDPAHAVPASVAPSTTAANALSVKEFKGIDGLAEMAKLVRPEFDSQYALPISYEVRNLANNQPVAIAAASAHELTNETTAKYRYQVRVDRLDIKDSFRQFFGFKEDGEFHMDIEDQLGRVGTVSKKCSEKDYSGVNLYTPVRTVAAPTITITATFRERDDRKGQKTSQTINLAALSDPNVTKHDVDLGEFQFDNRNKAWLTLIAVPPELPKE